MRTKKLVLILSMIIGCLFISVSGVAQQEHDLSLDLKLGQSYNLEIKAVQQIQQDFFGNQMTIKQNYNSKNNYRVKAIDKEDNYILAVKYDDLNLQIQELGGNFGGVQENQFKAKFNNSMSKATKTILDQEFTMKISPQGELIELKGYRELLSRWQSAVKKYQKENDLMMRSGIENFFDERFMKQLWKNLLAYIPQQSVKVGDSWESNFKLTAPLSTTINNKYILEQVGKKQIIIATEAPININDLELTQLQGQGVSYNLTGQQQGQLILNPDSNWIQGGKLKFDVSGTMEVENSMLEQKLSMPVSSFIDITLNTY
ncbi:DUF6263 family protein [Halanaerobacter jeridensis]|uniref:Uncharacterized protein YqkB n=1 Tax=Halanaerobacter jeridensis TaxID=706427 RepID=A0A938XS14_9FIRM|nr:DUF6263 family protein [Halanaerobacter jeridensis]MBM7556739.1 uncharacterized protein YqkB [Halanaerobacter jeridensis]